MGPPRKKKKIEKNKSETNKQITCEKCGGVFGLKKNLLRHIKLHHAKKIPNYRCTKCDKTCTTPYNLREHFISKHQIEISLDEVKKLNHPIANSKKGMCYFII